MVTDAEILGMFDEQGMTYQQIADKLNCTYDKVKNAIYRERKRRKGKIEYPDRKIYTDEDLADYATRMKESSGLPKQSTPARSRPPSTSTTTNQSV